MPFAGRSKSFPSLRHTLLYLARGYTQGKLVKLTFLADVLYHMQGVGLGVSWVLGRYGPFSPEVVDEICRLVDTGALNVSVEIDDEDPRYEYVTRLYAIFPPRHRDPVLDEVLQRFGDMKYGELIKYTRKLVKKVPLGGQIDLECDVVWF